MFDLEDIHAFAEVVEAGSLSRAAARLGMSKSMLSRRLTRLEANLGAQLLARTTRGMATTEAGTDFKLHADRILSEMQAGRDAVGRAGEATGRLRIAAPLSFGALHLAPILAELALRHPGLEIQTSYSDRRVDLVAEGFDVAVRIGDLPDSSLIARRIAPVFAVTVASPGYLATAPRLESPQDLDRHQTVRQHAEEVWRFLTEGREIVVRPAGRFIADSGEAILAAVVAGLGVARAPAFLVNAAMARGEVVQVLTDWPIPEAGLHVLRPPPSGYLPKKVKVLTDLLIDRFAASRDWEGCPRVRPEEPRRARA